MASTPSRPPVRARGRVRPPVPAFLAAGTAALLVATASVTVAAATDGTERVEAAAVAAATPGATAQGGLPTLPTPAPPPADAYADVPVREIGSISIPRIGLDHPMYSGVELTVLDHGPGHWPGTAAPGEWGNTVVAGHRVTNSRPFHDLDLLRPGDEIVVTTASGRHAYAVTGTEIVDDEALWIVDQEPGHTLTLFACHPKGSAAQRIVVRGELVGNDAV